MVKSAYIIIKNLIGAIFLNQLQIFEISLLFGAALGAFYDLFRIIRIFFKCKFWDVFIQDIIYFFVSAVSTFLFILFINSGEIRFYILAAEIMGWILYYITLGNLIYNIFYRFSIVIKKFFMRIFKSISAPVKKICRKIRVIVPKNINKKSQI